MEYSQNRLSVRRLHWLVILVASLSVMLPSALQAQQSAGETLSLALRSNVVSIVAERSDGIQNGFGFIVGERQGQVYIVTANHVVRSSGPDTTSQILIKYFHEQGRAYQATLLETSHQAYDLAVLQARAPTGLTWQQDALGLQKVERGTPVWFVGRSAEWYVPTVPGRINTFTLDAKYLIDNLPVRVGTSGAPLIADKGIIGMITADAGESSQAVSIEVIGRAFAQWNLPWGLTPPRRTSGTGRQDRPTTPADTPPVTAIPPVPPPASSQAPPASTTASAPPAVTGKLCPTLSNGETGIELAASREGQEFRVYSGDCIDLAPGTYVLTEEDNAIFCLPYNVKVVAGKTNDFRLTCR
jgi:hypothetical protein